MNDIDCSYDDLLCRSLSLFRQFRLYDDRIEEDNAFVFLREAEKVVSDTRNGVCVAKLGCVIECLAHRFYINDDTDVILEEVDAFLIKFWKGLKQPSPETFIASLWIGEYFLLRLKNPKSRLHGRSKNMVSKILSFMADMLRKPEKQKGHRCAIHLWPNNHSTDTVLQRFPLQNAVTVNSTNCLHLSIRFWQQTGRNNLTK